MLRSKSLAFAFWTAIIVAITVPWFDLQDHTHWMKVQWIPFVTPPVKALDVIGNVVLYIPYGALFPSRRWALAILAATIVSVAIEATQLYSHSRFPSLTDVTCNLLGAIVGFAIARRRDRS